MQYSGTGSACHGPPCTACLHPPCALLPAPSNAELYTRPVGSRRASGFTVHVPDSPVGVGGRKSGTIGSDPNTLSLGALPLAWCCS